jgi:hypothetical protein
VRLRQRTAAIAACALAVLAASATRAAADTRPVRDPSAAGALGNERLSDEERVSRWANAVLPAPVYSHPATSSRLAGRLRLQTEDGPLEVYLVLASELDAAGRSWVRVRLPGRPNGRKGWVLRDRLGDLHVVRTKLRVNRATLRATLYRDGRKIWSSPVGVGKAATPTPSGRFWIRTRLRNLGGGTIYGPLAFGTAAYSVLSDWPGGGVVGIHGTDEPALIPGPPVARLRARPQRPDPAPRRADADRDAGGDRLAGAGRAASDVPPPARAAIVLRRDLAADAGDGARKADPDARHGDREVQHVVGRVDRDQRQQQPTVADGEPEDRDDDVDDAVGDAEDAGLRGRPGHRKPDDPRQQVHDVVPAIDVKQDQRAALRAVADREARLDEKPDETDEHEHAAERHCPDLGECLALHATASYQCVGTLPHCSPNDGPTDHRT